MSDRLTDALAGMLRQANENRETDLKELADLEGQATAVRERLAGWESDITRLTPLVAGMAGAPVALAPRDVASGEHDLSLRIGWMLLGVPADAPPQDLRLYAAMMREIRDQSLHQARLAVDELARRGDQADVPTGANPIVPPHAFPVSEPCAHCGGAIVRIPNSGRWVHAMTGNSVCRPGADASPYAEPVDELPDPAEQHSGAHPIAAAYGEHAQHEAALGSPFDIGPDPDADVHQEEAGAQ